MESVSKIHADLNFAAYETNLRAVKGLWRSLEILRAKASSNSKLLAEYRTLLSRSIARVNESRNDIMSQREAEEAATEFIAWYEDQRRTMGIPNMESRRIPSSMEAWVEKWQPETWRRYQQAFQTACETQSRRAVEQLKVAARGVMQAFVEGFST